MGGLARRASYINTESNGNHLLVDCGDFGSNLSPVQMQKVNYLLKGMSLLGYDAINLGEKDLQYGKTFLSTTREKNSLPFVSANVYLAGTDELFAKPYVLKEINGVTVGIFGVATQTLKAEIGHSSDFEIRDPYQAIERVVAELKTQCDVIVGLCHIGLAENQILAARLAGIDFIISGHGWGLSKQPGYFSDTVVMQSGSKGKYLGHLEFDFENDEIADVSGKAVALNAKITDDAKLQNLIDEYDSVAIESGSGTN